MMIDRVTRVARVAQGPPVACSTGASTSRRCNAEDTARAAERPDEHVSLGGANVRALPRLDTVVGGLRRGDFRFPSANRERYREIDGIRCTTFQIPQRYSPRLSGSNVPPVRTIEISREARSVSYCDRFVTQLRGQLPTNEISIVLGTRAPLASTSRARSELTRMTPCDPSDP
jgi:hypothetical protein